MTTGHQRCVGADILASVSTSFASASTELDDKHLRLQSHIHLVRGHDRYVRWVSATLNTLQVKCKKNKKLDSCENYNLQWAFSVHVQFMTRGVSISASTTEHKFASTSVHGCSINMRTHLCWSQANVTSYPACCYCCRCHYSINTFVNEPSMSTYDVES